jgi:hypothetical protein
MTNTYTYHRPARCYSPTFGLGHVLVTRLYHVYYRRVVWVVTIHYDRGNVEDVAYGLTFATYRAAQQYAKSVATEVGQSA